MPPTRSHVVGDISGIDPQALNKDADTYNAKVKRLKLHLESVTVAHLSSRERRAVCNAEIAPVFDGRNIANRFPVEYEVRAKLDASGEIAVLGDLSDATQTTSLLLNNLAA